MTAADRQFRLAYPVATVTWDGKCISRRPHEAIIDDLEMLRSCGINEVMLSGYHLEEPSSFDVDEETRWIGHTLADRGIKGSQHHAVASCFAPLGTSQAGIIEQLKRCVDFTANLHCGSMVFHAGKRLGRDADQIAAFEEEVARHGLDDVINIVCDNLHQAGEYALQRGVIIALENLDRFIPLSNTSTLPRLIRGAASEGVGFCLDTGHAWCAGTSIVEWIALLGDKLVTTHIHDNHGAPPWVLESSHLIKSDGIDEHLPPGFGTIPWTEVITSLWQYDYRETLTFESGGWPGLPAGDGLRHAIAYWRTSELLAQKRLAKHAVPQSL